MLTAGTFGAGIRKIIADAGAIDKVDRRALARVLGQFEMLFRHYAPAYPHDRFPVGLKFLLAQGCPKALVVAISQAWETASGKRERTPANIKAGVMAGVTFANWWQKRPDFLASFARLAEKMATADPSKSSRRMRQSGVSLKVVVPDELRDELEEPEDGPPEAEPESGPAGRRAVRQPTKLRRAEDLAAPEQILDAELADDDLREEPLVGAGDLLTPAGSMPVPALRRPAAGEEAIAIPVDVASAVAIPLPAGAIDAEPVPAEPVDAISGDGGGSAAIQAFIRKSKAKVAQLTQAANAAARQARELNEAGQAAMGKLKAGLAGMQQAKAKMLQAVKVWEEAKARVATLTQQKAPPTKLAAARTLRKQAADAARAAQEHAKQVAAGLAALKEKAQAIARQRGVVVARAKAAADQRAKVIASTDKQVAAAKAKQAGHRQRQQAQRPLSDADAIPIPDDEVLEVEAEALAIPVSSAPVVTRYSGPRAPSSPRNVRSGRVMAVKAPTRSAAGAPLPAAVARMARAADPAPPPAARKPAARKPAARAEPPAPAAPPPPPPATSPAARAREAAAALRADTGKARSQLDIVERALEKGPAPYEAFRLYLQRSAILRVTQPDHADLPSAATIAGMKREIADARQQMGGVRNAPDWATLIHVWLLSVWGPQTYLMLDQLRVLDSPWQLPQGQKVSLLLVHPPFVWLCRKPRGTGFVRDPRIPLLQLDPWACAPSLAGGAVHLTLAWADADATPGARDGQADTTGRQRVVLECPVRPDLGQQGTLAAIEDFLGDVLTVRTQYVKHVFQRLAARRLHRNTFDAYLGQLQKAQSLPGLPERVSGLRLNLDRMLRNAVFSTRPVELADAPFTQLLDLALEHKVLVGKDVRRRAQRIRQTFDRDDARLPAGMLENVALDFNIVNRSLLADRAPASRSDKAWDESYVPPATKAVAAKPWTGIEGDPTSYLARLVATWAGGQLPTT